VSGGEIVIVPAWKRPDFLTACLQRLLIADDGRQQYRICLDRGFTREVGVVAEQFARQLGARALIRRRSHRYRGNSYNVLMGYKEAVAAGPDLVHLVEEDIFVAADYFEFHRRAHELTPDTFAVSACRNQQFPREMNPPDQEDAVYAHVSYQSLGVSFRIGPIAKVVQHAQNGYFERPIAYCARHWPGTAINPNNAEQDGLIARMIEAIGWHTVYPFSPRAYHAGFVGYHHKGAVLVGTVEQRAATLLRMTTAELNAASYSYPNHVAVDLDANRKPVDRVAVWP
jgi:hypothetical protein